ncbi:MAG: hypothetical protein A2147_02620 [Chloroflexi bacterium RBG_16_57_8]|nr:MAG: hypothetical protein A2147_02620 [Chloroflexi bacterium RBG_16_57_8]
MIELLKSYGIWIFAALMIGLHLAPMFIRGRRAAKNAVVRVHDNERPMEKEGQQQSGKQSPGCH